MTLPASGALTLTAIATEFGGSAPHAMSEYYAAAAGVPASGAIKFSDFYGKSAATVTLDATYGVASDTSGPNTAGFKLTSTGDIHTELDALGFSDTTSNWIDPVAAAPGLYEARASIVSGSVTAGSSSTATWLPLTSDVQWRRLSGALNITQTVVLTVEIRYDGGAVLDTSTVTLSAVRR